MRDCAFPQSPVKVPRWRAMHKCKSACVCVCVYVFAWVGNLSTLSPYRTKICTHTTQAQGAVENFGALLDMPGWYLRLPLSPSKDQSFELHDEEASSCYCMIYGIRRAARVREREKHTHTPRKRFIQRKLIRSCRSIQRVALYLH